MRICSGNIGSVSGILVKPFAGAYCASKAAAHALSDALRMEVAPLGIDVVTVQPGAIRPEFGATASRGLDHSTRERSVYAPLADAIAARANASQQHSTTAEDFAQRLVDVVLAPCPPRCCQRSRAGFRARCVTGCCRGASICTACAAPHPERPAPQGLI